MEYYLEMIHRFLQTILNKTITFKDEIKSLDDYLMLFCDKMLDEETELYIFDMYFILIRLYNYSFNHDVDIMLNGIRPIITHRISFKE